MLRRTIFTVLVTSVAGIVLTGCTRGLHEAPDGFSIVREHTISGPPNDPPILSELDFTILDIDGESVVRENIPFWWDMQRGAIVPAGRHRFRALVAPHYRPKGYRNREMIFDGVLEGGKVYYLIGKNDGPLFVEANPRPK